MQWFIFLIKLDMQYFMEDNDKKKEMYKHIKQMRKKRTGEKTNEL